MVARGYRRGGRLAVAVRLVARGRHLLLGQRIEVYPEAGQGDDFRLEADMLLFASPLGRPTNEDETPEEDPERLVHLVAGARSDWLHTIEHPLRIRVRFSS